MGNLPLYLEIKEVSDRHRGVGDSFPFAESPSVREWGIPEIVDRILSSLPFVFLPAGPSLFQRVVVPLGADRARETFPYLGSERDRLCFAFSFPSLSVESTIPKGLPAESGESLRS